MAPDHLQAPPFAAFAGAAAKWLHDHNAVGGFQPQPGEISQHHAAGQQGSGLPFLVVIEHRDFPAGRNSDGSTRFEALCNTGKFQSSTDQPGYTSDSSNDDVKIEYKYQNEACGDQYAARRQYDDS